MVGLVFGKIRACYFSVRKQNNKYSINTAGTKEQILWKLHYSQQRFFYNKHPLLAQSFLPNTAEGMRQELSAAVMWPDLGVLALP